MGILRTMEGNWFNVVASHAEAEVMERKIHASAKFKGRAIGRVLLFPSETGMEIWGYVDASVLSF